MPSLRSTRPTSATRRAAYCASSRRRRRSGPSERERRRTMVRGIVFDEDAARDIERRLRADGYAVTVTRERYAGEDDDEDHPWAIETDAPAVALDLLLE